jgi:hypothetical protein
MREKDYFDRVLAPSRGHFSDLEWDGQNVWVSNPEKGIWVLDTSGQVAAEIDPDSGLPPGEKGLLMHTIEPGRILVVGSCGPFSRGWCSIVEFKDGKASVNVFHQARRVPTSTDDKEEIQRDPFVVFKPTSIGEYQEEGRRRLLIGRSKKKYLLQVDPTTLDVSIALPRRSPPGLQSPRFEYDGKVYVPGKIWASIDPKTGRQERLVTQGQLPAPYSSLQGFWASAHYGLVGWHRNRELWQIRITDEEQEILVERPPQRPTQGPAEHLAQRPPQRPAQGPAEHLAQRPTQHPPRQGLYFHTFSFEGSKGIITSTAKLNSVLCRIERNGKRVRQFPYRRYKKGGYFPLGTYKAWKIAYGSSWTKGVEFAPIEVTEDSPEHLVFKLKYKRILYSGRVVNAITGEPMNGAFVMAGGGRNLAWITQEHWKELHKLPTNPSLSNEALRPIKDTSPFKPGLIVRTGPDGRFEITSRPDALIFYFVAFEENYLSTELGHSGFPPLKDGQVEFPPMPLFPAAKIMIEPYVGCSNVWLGFIAEPNENSSRATTFFNMYGGYSSGPEVYRPSLKGQVRQPYHVPAGVRFKMKFSIPYEEKWCIPDIPQTINLKQGETLDLGRFVFDPALKIFLKVIDSAGKPVVGVPIVRWFDDISHNIRALETDSSGKAAFYVEPNLEVKFTIYRDQKSWKILKTVTCEVGGREDEGKEFTVKL